MKKIFLPLAFISLLLFTATASAVNFYESDSQVTVSNPVTDDLYIAGGEVTISQRIEGDLVVAGGKVEVLQDVAGDLIIAGGEVTLRGNVGDDIRGAAGKVVMNGNVGDDLIMFGGTIEIGPDATIGGSLVAAGGMIVLDGTVQEDFIGGGDTIRFRGWINGNAELNASDLSISPNSRIGGNLTYSTNGVLEIPEGVVQGTVSTDDSLMGPKTRGGLSIAGHLGFLVWAFLAILLIGAILIVSLPYGMLPMLAEDMKKHFWVDLGTGFVVAIVGGVSVVIGFMSIIGIPLGMLLMMLLAASWIVSKVIAGVFVGSYLMKMEKSKWRVFGALCLGLFTFYVVRLIPIFGWVITTLVTLLAFGSFAKIRWNVIGFLTKKKFW